MKRFITPTLAALALAACSDASHSPVAPASPEQLAAPLAPFYQKIGTGIEGEYIVVFKDGVTDALSKADAKILKHAGVKKYAYDKVIKGFAARLSPGAVAMLQADPDVAYIEQDGVVTTQATQSGATWGIDRIDQRARPLSGTYTYTTHRLDGVTAYIIDTGIQTSHSQFGGRGGGVVRRARRQRPGLQRPRHARRRHGRRRHLRRRQGRQAARGARARLQRLGEQLGRHRRHELGARRTTSRTSVANMSLGGGYSSSAMNTAANNLASCGVFLAVAAGNSNANACNSSPASAANVTTVAASTSTDARATYSNYGSCVDLYAPGSSITSAWLNGGTNTISGTSMATPHVVGVAALYKATYGDASYSTIRTWLINNSTANVITGNPTGTPNRLLYKSTL